MERWKPIKDYEGIYEVSSCGRVRSLPRIKMRTSATGKKYATEVPAKILKPYTNPKGYFLVDLSKNGKNKRCAVHRLVALAFVEGYAEGLFVNHKDECKTNNHVSNLEWCTNKYNANYGTAIERRSQKQRHRIMHIPTGRVFASKIEAQKQMHVSYRTLKNPEVWKVNPSTFLPDKCIHHDGCANSSQSIKQFITMKLKLKVQKVNQINPANKKKGFAARVVSNGTAEFGELCEHASLNTTYNPAEVEACAKLFVQAVVAELKKGMIVDLGPIGKLRPSCTSGWKETAEELTMDAIRTHVNYDASDDIKAAIQGASLSWAKASDEEENDNENPGSEQGGGEMPPMSME